MSSIWHSIWGFILVITGLGAFILILFLLGSIVFMPKFMHS